MRKNIFLIAVLALMSAFVLTSVANAAPQKGPEGCLYVKKLTKAQKKAGMKQCAGQVKHKAPVAKVANPFAAVTFPEGTIGASASSSSQADVTVLAFVKAKGLTKAQKAKMKCVRVPAGTGYWNSAKQANGQLRWFWDTRAGTICTTKSGKQFRAECANQVRSKPPAKKVVKGEVKLVRTFGNFSVRASASVKVRVEGVCGFAEASAEAVAVAKGVTKAQAKGNAQVIASGKATARAKVNATALLKCAPITPPTPPTPPTTCEQRGDCPPPPPPPPPTPPTKDGTKGPGEGTPGQPGGPGAGGEPGHPTDGRVCRNADGDIVTGESDQFGYCVA